MLNPFCLKRFVIYILTLDKIFMKVTVLSCYTVQSSRKVLKFWSSGLVPFCPWPKTVNHIASVMHAVLVPTLHPT